MEEGTKTKRTIFVGGFADDVDEAALVQAFSTFGSCFYGGPTVLADSGVGDIVEVQIPPAQTNASHTNGSSPSCTTCRIFDGLASFWLENKHRGFAFITYISAQDALDAIDNMDLNELHGRVLKVNIARPSKGPVQGLGNRAGEKALF